MKIFRTNILDGFLFYMERRWLSLLVNMGTYTRFWRYVNTSCDSYAALTTFPALKITQPELIYLYSHEWNKTRLLAEKETRPRKKSTDLTNVEKNGYFCSLCSSAEVERKFYNASLGFCYFIFFKRQSVTLFLGLCNISRNSTKINVFIILLHNRVLLILREFRLTHPVIFNYYLPVRYKWSKKYIVGKIGAYEIRTVSQSSESFFFLIYPENSRSIK